MRFGKCSLLSIVTVGFFVGTSAHAATYVVEKFGTANTECSKKNPCLKIQTALDVATKNAKVIVGPGIYEETLSIVKEGLKLESSGGMHATRIDATGDFGVPAIVVSADKVSVGKKKGKGFDIIALNAPGVYAGEYWMDDCTYGGILEDGSKWYYPIGTINPITNFKLEGNSITTKVNAENVLESYGTYCKVDEVDDDIVTLITLDILPAVTVFGSGAKIVSNTITSQGTNGVIMANPLSKYLFQDNVVRHQPFAEWTDPYYGELNYGGFLQMGNWGATGTIKGNNLANTVPGYGRGILVGWSEKSIKIQGNAIKGFEGGVDGSSPKISVDKNIITDVYGIGVWSAGMKSIKDNIIQGVSSSADWAGIQHFPDLETGKVDIKGNNISNFLDPGIMVVQTVEPPKTSTWKISNNNLYNVGDEHGGCGIFVGSSMSPVKLSKNFYGDMTNLPDELESEQPYSYVGPGAAGSGVAICAGVGRVSGIPPYGSLSANPSLKPNKIKAKFQQDVMISGNL